MSSAPILRPPIPGSRNNSGKNTPKLGLPGLSLAIPPSPNARPVNNGDPAVTTAAPAGVPHLERPMPPRLQLSVGAPQPAQRAAPRLAPLQMPGASSSSTASFSDGSEISRPGSSQPSSQLDLSPSTNSSRPNLTIPRASDPISAHSTHSPGGNAVDLPDLTKLVLSQGRPLDVDDLDDLGWKAASKNGLIVEYEELGEGAGGAVKRCKLKDGKTAFALKVITSNPDPDVKRQIFRELSFNKSCDCEYICRYYGAFQDDSATSINIIMEYCEGGSLDAVYKEVHKLGGRTGEKVLGKVAEGVLKGLTYLYKHKIIHRDIKPSNILLNRQGQVKLCDFGVSGEFGTKGDANTFIGTSYYMAPERITGQSYTITSDVWSLGVTLLEVAQHRFPFPADGTEMQPKANMIDLLTYIVSQPVPKLKDEPQNDIKWSENFKYFIECCLERDPARRATPWRMLDHPWMQDMEKKRVNMEHFLKTVWDWKD